MEIQKNMYGCYLLTLLHFARVEGKATFFYEQFIKNGWIDEDCFIKKPNEIATCLFGGKWNVIESSNPDPNANYTVKHYYNPKTNQRHFCSDDYDPFGDSTTSQIESYHLFYKIGD